MIWVLFFGFTGILLRFIAFLFGFITAVLPGSLVDGIVTLFSYVGYFRGVFPVDQLIAAFSFFTSFVILLYSVRIILFVYALIPIIGKEVNLPHNVHSEGLRSNSSLGGMNVGRYSSNTSYSEGRKRIFRR